MSYQLVTQLHKEAVSTARSCQVLAVSRSGPVVAELGLTADAALGARKALLMFLEAVNGAI
jgi:hypothetical protein